MDFVKKGFIFEGVSSGYLDVEVVEYKVFESERYVGYNSSVTVGNGYQIDSIENELRQFEIILKRKSNINITDKECFDKVLNLFFKSNDNWSSMVCKDSWNTVSVKAVSSSVVKYDNCDLLKVSFSAYPYVLSPIVSSRYKMIAGQSNSGIEQVVNYGMQDTEFVSFDIKSSINLTNLKVRFNDSVLVIPELTKNLGVTYRADTNELLYSNGDYVDFTWELQGELMIAVSRDNNELEISCNELVDTIDVQAELVVSCNLQYPVSGI